MRNCAGRFNFLLLFIIHSALQEDKGFSIVTQETDDIFKIFKQIHDWKS